MTLQPQTAELDLNRLYTAEEFMNLRLDPDKKHELVKGIIKEMSHPGGEHMLVCSRLMTALILFLAKSSLGGVVLPPGSFKLNIPGAVKDTVRSPDLTFVRAENVALLGSGAVTFLPDLAVEVISSQDESGELAQKLQEYQQSGWNLVWVLYPKNAPAKKDQRTVRIYRLQEESRLQPAQTLKLSDTLLGEAALDGFATPVKALFE